LIWLKRSPGDAALFAWAAVCLTVPFVPHGWLVFPETPGALVVAWAALWLWQPIEQRLSTWAAGFALGFLVWLHTKFAIFLALFGVALLVRLWRRPSGRGLRSAHRLCVAAWLYYFYAIYGVIDFEAPYGDYTRTFVLLRNIPRAAGAVARSEVRPAVYSPIYCWRCRVSGSGRCAESRYLGTALVLVTAAYVASSARRICGGAGPAHPHDFSFPSCHVLRR
jgi:hypothetical protein